MAFHSAFLLSAAFLLRQIRHIEPIRHKLMTRTKYINSNFAEREISHLILDDDALGLVGVLLCVHPGEPAGGPRPEAGLPAVGERGLRQPPPEAAPLQLQGDLGRSEVDEVRANARSRQLFSINAPQKRKITQIRVHFVFEEWPAAVFASSGRVDDVELALVGVVADDGVPGGGGRGRSGGREGRPPGRRGPEGRPGRDDHGGVGRASRLLRSLLSRPLGNWNLESIFLRTRQERRTKTLTQ